MEIAVVIPALDEADRIVEAIRTARRADSRSGPAREPGQGHGHGHETTHGPVREQDRGPQQGDGPGRSRDRGRGPDRRPARSSERSPIRSPGRERGRACEQAGASVEGRTAAETGVRPTCVGDASGVEILVVDGGSRDDTSERARRVGARVLQSEPGRARQLEAGWRATTGETVLFLHADTRLGEGWRRAIDVALADPRVAGGAFRLRFDDVGVAYRVLEVFVALRVRLFGLPYGDQAIFVRRRILEALGGIRPVPVMEDLDLVAGMKAYGRVVSLAPPATTSARRYRENGFVRTVVAHALALLAWRLGVDRARIGRWVRG